MSTPIPQAPAPAPAAPARSNGLAVAGFVVGLVSIVLCLVPILNNLVFFTALVGLVLAIIGVVKARGGAPRRGLAVAGIVLSVLAGIGVLASQAFYSSVLDDVADSLDDTVAPAETTDTDSAASGTDDDVAEAVEEEAPAEPEAEPGSREQPFAFAEAVSNDDWAVQLGEPYEAWEDIRAENEFNEAPGDGMEYWIVPVEATYTGAETGTPWIDLTVEFVGDDSVTYGDHYCGVIPDDLTDTDELYEGGTATGNVCVVVPAGAKGSWTLTAGWFADPVFFRAQG